jgi:rSAM/selenodomain-associated transferase 1
MKSHPLDQNIHNSLIVVAKQPAPGMTKTRLSPPLSPEQASSLYECFLLDTLDLIRQVPGVQPAIAYLPEGARDYFASLAPDFDLLQQSGRNLGERLDHALTHYLLTGYRNAVIMDSDSPSLPVGCLASAFAMLDNGSDVVIGPCEDGGYYLIGLKKSRPRLLREVRMSTPHVTADTLALAAKEGLKVGLLPTWYDVDDHRSLRRLQSELRHSSNGLAPHTRIALRLAAFKAALTLPDNQVGLPDHSEKSSISPS